MKKGFTLVELIAVIVILTVVGMITVPIVVKYIEESRITSYKVSVENVIEAAIEYVTKKEENHDFPEGGIRVEEELNIKEGKIKSGIVKRNEEGIIEAENIYDGRYCASGSKNNIIVKKVETKEECQGIDTTAPDLKIKVNHVTESKITVVAIARDSLSKIKGYEYCIGKECSGEIKKNNYTFEGLKAGEEYKIKVKVRNENDGKIGYPKEATEREKTIKVKTEKVEGAIFEVSTSGYAGSKEVRIKYPKGDYERIYEIYDFEQNLIQTEKVEKEEIIIKIETNSIIKAIVKYGTEKIESEIYIVGIDQRGPEVVVIMKDSWEQVKQIEVIAKDEIGIATKGYSYDGGKNWNKNNKRTYQNNGRVKLFVRDRLGNITDHYKICTDKSETNCYEAEEIVISKIDNVKPTCSLEITSGEEGTNKWYLSDVTVDFKEMTDTAIGVDGEINSGSGIISHKIDLPKISKEGKYKVTGTVIDLAGNEGICEIEVKIDKTNPSVPTGEIRYNNEQGEEKENNEEWTKETLWFGNIKGKDDLSGIDHYEYSEGCTGEKSGNLTSYVFNSTINTKWCIRSVDESGRVSEWSRPYHFKVDKTPPSIPTGEIRYDSSGGSIRGSINEFTNRTLWFGNFRASDEHTGIDHYEYSTGCTGNKSGNLSNSGHLYTTDVNYIFCIRSVDKVGNQSGWSSPYYIKVDKTPPTIQLSIQGGTVGNGYQNGLRVNVICNDNLSGIASNVGSTTLYGPGWRSVSGVCVDKAGNSNSTSGSYLIYVYSQDAGACGVSNYVCGEYQCNPYNCNSYQCNPHNCNAYSCNCHQVSKPIWYQCKDENGNNRPGGCWMPHTETQCSTCYRTCYDTCYQTCYQSCPVMCSGANSCWHL